MWRILRGYTIGKLKELLNSIDLESNATVNLIKEIQKTLNNNIKFNILENSEDY